LAKASSSGARTRARELLVQALYQHQIAGHDARELLDQFHEQAAYLRAEQDMFDEWLPGILSDRDALEHEVESFLDRPLEQLDPIERAILLIGTFELKDHIEVPYRVVINEGVNLAKRFGAIDSHKYVNACLDRAAAKLRAIEVEAHGRG
jgi:N utilization substance protein B